MPAPRDVTEVRSGVVYPSRGDMKKVVAKVRRTLKAKPQLVAEFKRDPRQFLGALGLNEDVQNTLINEMGLHGGREGCSMSCIITGMCGGCCITSISLDD